MKKTTAKIIQISDIVQWNEKNEIELSPKYQRNSVWNEKAKSYLIDTIVRGLPIPPIFLRQKVDINTKSTSREIIDGQQRVRTILEYVVNESFSIKKSHNKQLGGKKYSDLDPEMQEAILEYEIIAEVVTEKEETAVYDMFARLNSNNIVLNRQEIRNSKFWGEFKVTVYNLSSQYRDFFLTNSLLSDTECSRMKDSELISSLLMVLLDGITTETPKSVDDLYQKYDKDFPNSDEIEASFISVMQIITKLYEYLNGNYGCFKNKNYFFTLYCVIVNQMYGLQGLELPRNPIYSSTEIENNEITLYESCISFIHDYDTALNDKRYSTYLIFSDFEKLHKTRTTSKNERIKRITFLNEYIGRDTNDSE